MDEETRADIDRFYGDVLELAVQPLRAVRATGHLLVPDEGQFILLMEVDEPIHSPSYDHLGLLMDTREEVDDLLEACRRYQEKDDRLRLKLFDDIVTPTVTQRAFYVSYLLPIWFDVCALEYPPGAEPARALALRRGVAHRAPPRAPDAGTPVGRCTVGAPDGATRVHAGAVVQRRRGSRMVEDWSAGATIGGRPIPALPDMARLRAERFAKIQDQLEAQGIDGLVLLGLGGASPIRPAPTHPARTAAGPGSSGAVSVVHRGRERPAPLHPVPATGCRPSSRPIMCTGRSSPTSTTGSREFADALHAYFPAGARLGVDEQTHPMLRALDISNGATASAVLGAAKIIKTPDEVSAIREAQRITEQAMESAREALRPGLRQTELSGIFLRRIFELGATANAIDPIWQVMDPTKAEGPWTTHGDLAYPISTTDQILREGDVIWVDAGICHQGYASDFGRTWITSARPDPPNARPPTSSAGAPWWPPPATSSSRACPPSSSGGPPSRPTTA